MSLFKACDWWSTTCGADEEFDKGCLAVANIDNNSDNLDKIITGSHSGVLRIYKPLPIKQEDGTYSSFRPDDLLLETQLKNPIIHLGVGVLSSTSTLLQLAVLQPFKLSVFSVSVNGHTVESYRFQSLASASDDNTENENIGFKGKRVAPEWTYILADSAMDIIMVDDKTSPTVAILGEKFVTGLNSHGSIKFSKKLSFMPRCFTCYREEHHGFLIILVVTANQTLLIYHETQLKWAVQLMFPPICITRASFTDIRGILTLLSEEGSLACCYLGTQPSLFVSPLSEPQEIDFKVAEQEMERLKKVIKSSNQ
ncbi:Protein PTHB1, partial [Araneus ventricosus]